MNRTTGGFVWSAGNCLATVPRVGAVVTGRPLASPFANVTRSCLPIWFCSYSTVTASFTNCWSCKSVSQNGVSPMRRPNLNEPQNYASKTTKTIFCRLFRGSQFDTFVEKRVRMRIPLIWPSVPMETRLLFRSNPCQQATMEFGDVHK